MISKVFKDPPRASDPALASVSGYAAFYKTDDGKTKLKPEVVVALDEWGWRSKEWPTRETAEVNAFISGWEAAMRHNDQADRPAGRTTQQTYEK